ARRGGVGALAGGGAVLGDVAVRAAAPAAPARPPPARAGAGGARRPGRRPQVGPDALRQPVRDVVPLLDGLARRALRRGAGRPLAAPRPRLPAAATLGDGEEVHGRLRDARRSPARPHARASRRPPPQPPRRTLPRRSGAEIPSTKS